jgi:hypothetical protein
MAASHGIGHEASPQNGSDPRLTEEIGAVISKLRFPL